MKSFFLMISLLLATSISSQAQVSGGNGGGYVIQFKHYRDAISAWLNDNLARGTLDKKLHLKENGITPELLVAKYKIAVLEVAERIEIGDEQVLVGPAQKSKPCGNFKNSIRCYKDDWKFALKLQSMDYLYALVLHEYLGIAQIEQNDQDFTQAPISPYLMNYASEIMEQVKLIEAEQVDLNICDAILFIDPSKNNPDSQLLQRLTNVFTENHLNVTRQSWEATHQIYFKLHYETGEWMTLELEIKDSAGHRVFYFPESRYESAWNGAPHYSKTERILFARLAKALPCFGKTK